MDENWLRRIFAREPSAPTPRSLPPGATVGGRLEIRAHGCCELIVLWAAATQSLVSCKVIRHKTTQMSRGYGFLLFNSPEAAHQVLTQLNGTQIPGGCLPHTH